MSVSCRHAAAEYWKEFVRDIGVELANPADLREACGRLYVLNAQWFGLEDDDKGIVELHVRTVTGRVLCLDMWLERGAIEDVTHDYDEGGKNLSKPEDVARCFGESAN